MAENLVVELRKLGRKLSVQYGKAAYKTNPVLIARERAAHDSAEYIEQNCENALLFPQKGGLHNFAMEKVVHRGGLHLEFGVFKGESINRFSSLCPDIAFHGFDSFEGLQEDWVGYHMPKGTFDLGGNLPKVNENVELIPGWFDKTLPSFLKKNKEEVGFLHVDCDTYESSKYVIETLGDRIVPGTLILFDEYFGYVNWRNGEFRAWQDWVAAKGLNYTYLGFSSMQALVRVEKPGNG